MAQFPNRNCILTPESLKLTLSSETTWLSQGLKPQIFNLISPFQMGSYEVLDCLLLRSVLARHVWYTPKRFLLLRLSVLIDPHPHCPLPPRSYAIDFQNVIPAPWDFLAPKHIQLHQIQTTATSCCLLPHTLLCISPLLHIFLG